MSAKLFNEPPQREQPPKKTIRQIDDLILDAEIEAQAEIDRKLRTNKTKMLLLVLAGVGLLYAFIGPQNLSIPIPSFLDSESQVAEAPPAPPGPTPKPIPFPVGESAPAPGIQAPSAPAQNEGAEQDLSPLENEVISMIQKNLGASEPENPESPVLSGKSPFTPDTQRPVSPAAPAASATPAPKADRGPKTAAPELTAPRLTAEQSRFFIQVGAFSVKANADRVIQRLMSGGFSPLVQTRTTRTSMYVVFIGGFADDSHPQSMISELKKKGLNPVLKKNDTGSYSIVLGKEKSKAKAEALKEDLARKGIFTSLKQMKINSRMYIVRVGNFDSNTSAVKNQKKIENMGYKGTLIRKKS